MMGPNRCRNLPVLLSILSVLFFAPRAQGQDSPPSFRNLIAVGDSLTAGFQNSSLNSEGQNHSYAAFFARQAGTFLFLPQITDPGIPNKLILLDPGPPPVIAPAPGPGGTRRFPLIVPQNLAVPGQTTIDALTVRPELPLDSVEDLILGVPSLVIPGFPLPALSQIEMAFALQPSFTLFWLGSNEVLGAVLAGDAGEATPFAVFQQAYQTAVGTILATGSKIVVANVPDVTSIPFLVRAEVVAALSGAPLQVIGPILGVSAGDFVTLPGVPLAASILTGEAVGPLPDAMVLTADEAVVIRGIVEQMNAFIDQFAGIMNFPVVDINSLLGEIGEKGIQIGDRRLTTDLLGGIFSLDGVHPTNTGQAIVANAFIETVNSFYGLAIPAVDLEQIAAADPLVPPAAFTEFVLEQVVLPYSLSTEAIQSMVILLRGERRVADQSSGQGADPEKPRNSGFISPQHSPLSMEERLLLLPAFRLEPGFYRPFLPGEKSERVRRREVDQQR